MSLQWFTATLNYYGIVFTTISLSADPYANFTLLMTAEAVSHIFSLIVLNVIGRRRLLIASQALAGTACLAAGLGLEGPSWAVTVLVMTGKFGAACAFNTVYLYTAELYPTNVRGRAMGLCSTVARVAGFAAVLIGALARVWRPLPMVVMGSWAVVCGVLAGFFPETAWSNMPETMEDAIMIGTKEKKNGQIRTDNQEE